MPRVLKVLARVLFCITYGESFGQVRLGRIELPTFSMSMKRSTTELKARGFYDIFFARISQYHFTAGELFGIW